MNFIKKAGDYELYMEQKRKRLGLEIENTNRTLNAMKMYARTGYIPRSPADDRTTREKLADTVKLQQDVTEGLKEIADGTEISQIISQLTDGELIFLAQHLSEIIKTLKPRYRYGIMSREFLDYLRTYIDTYTAAHGVDFGGNTGLLDRIETLINRLPQRNDINDVATILRQQIAIATEYLEERIAEAEASNDKAQQEYFLRLMREINEKHNILFREIQDYGNILEGFQNSLENIETSLGEVNKEQLNEIVENLKGLPDMSSLVKKLEDIQNAIQNSDYQTLKRRYDELYQDVQRYKNALDISQTKARVFYETNWRPYAWSTIKRMKLPDLLEYLQLTEDIIMKHDMPTLIDENLATTSAIVLDKIRNIRSVFFPLRDEYGDVYEEETDVVVNLRSIVNELIEDLKKELNKNPSDKEIREAIIERYLSKANIDSKEKFIKWMEDDGLPESLNNFFKQMKNTVVPVQGEEESKESGPPPVTGSGLGSKTAVYFPQRGRGIISGKGLDSKPKPRKRYDKINPEDVDHSRGVKPTPKFVPLGKYFVNHHRLINDGFLSIKSMSGAGVHGLPPTKVSQNFVDVIESMLKNKNPSFDALNNLSQGEKEYLYKLAKKSNILDRFTIPTPDKSKEDKELHEFEVLRGQIMAGNDNKDLIKKFKFMLVKLTRDGLIPKSQSNVILTELATLGY